MFPVWLTKIWGLFEFQHFLQVGFRHFSLAPKCFLFSNILLLLLLHQNHQHLLLLLWNLHLPLFLLQRPVMVLSPRGWDKYNRLPRGGSLDRGSSDMPVTETSACSWVKGRIYRCLVRPRNRIHGVNRSTGHAQRCRKGCRFLNCLQVGDQSQRHWIQGMLVSDHRKKGRAFPWGGRKLILLCLPFRCWDIWTISVGLPCLFFCN